MRLRRLTQIVAASVAVAGCGFEPLYGRFGGSSSITDELATVKIQIIADRSGQILRNRLLDGMSPRGQPERPAYVLVVVLNEPLPQNLGTARDDSTVRYAYTTTAIFRLAVPDGRIVLEGQSSSLTSYEATNSQFATLAGQINARDRVLEEIADDVRQQIAVYFRSQRGASRSAI